MLFAVANLGQSITGLLKRFLLGRWVFVPDPYHHPQVRVGRHTYGLGPFTIRIYTKQDKVVIGSFCSISKDVKIIASGEHYAGRVSTYPFIAHMLHGGAERDTRIRGQVNIGNDVWIGTGAIILSGARVGNGAAIAAGSVVTGQVDDYAIVGGVPARLIRYRFDEKHRQELLEIAWWGWSDDVLLSRLEHFYGSVDEFIRLYGKEAANS